MGTIESSLAKLTHAGIQTYVLGPQSPLFERFRITTDSPSTCYRNTLRIYRCRVFLNDEAMSVALADFQKRNPELWGTFEQPQPGQPLRYVDTYDPEDMEETYVPTDAIRETETQQNSALERAIAESKEQMILNTPASEPKFMNAIPLEVVEGADINTYYSEVTNMINVPFSEGAPLMSVRIVRHGGGSDLLISGHQSLYDESSFDALCVSLLDTYVIAAEGRLRDLQSSKSPMLLNVDSMYPPSYQELIKNQNANESTLQELDRDAYLSRLPYESDSKEANLYTSAPPSPTLNSSATMFGTLSLEHSRKLRRKCEAKGLAISSVVAAAAMLQTGSMIASQGHRFQNKNSTFLSRLRDALLPEGAKLDDKTPPSFVAGQILSLRDFFDPPIPSHVSGPLSSYLLMPDYVDAKKSIWKKANEVQDVSSSLNQSSSIFYDISHLPTLTDYASSDEDWTQRSLPTAWISETSNSLLSDVLRVRLQIFDTQATTSCWNPGVTFTSRIDADVLRVSISYRKPLVQDATAKDLLEGVLKRLSL